MIEITYNNKNKITYNNKNKITVLSTYFLMIFMMVIAYIVSISKCYGAFFIYLSIFVFGIVVELCNAVKIRELKSQKRGKKQ